MTILLFFSVLIFGFFFYLGLNLYLINRKELTHKLFLCMLSSLTIMALGCAFAYSAANQKNIVFWFRITLSGILLYFPFSVHFCASLTKTVNFTKKLSSLIYLPPLVLIIKNWLSLFYLDTFIKKGDLWLMKPSNPDIWFYILGAYLTLTTLFSLSMLFIWKKKAASNKEKKQANIIFFTLLTTFLIATGESLILPAITEYWTLGLAPLSIGIWIGGILYCFVRFKLFALTPRLIGLELANNIRESLLLLDTNFTIIYSNNACQQTLSQTKQSLENSSLQQHIIEWDLLAKSMDEIKNNTIESLSCRAHFKTGDQKKLEMDLRISLIQDKFRDPIGIMIVGYEIKGHKQLKLVYHITEREIEVMQRLVNGASNKEIAKQLSISERTIKTHLTNIYNKTGVDNKIQLFNFLQEFNLIPQHSAERRLLILKQEK